MYSKDHLHVLLAADEHYAEFVCTVIVSLFETNKKFNKISIHLLSNKIPDNLIETISQYVPKDRGELCVYEIPNIYDMGLTLDKDTSDMSVTSYARLLSTKLLPSTLSRVLYVDCDVIFNGDVFRLWTTDLDGYWVAGSLDVHTDTSCKTKLGLSEKYPYINAGVLLLNLEEWRKVDIVNKWKDVIDKYNGAVFHQDQGIINEACQNHIKLLPPLYNVTSLYFTFPYDKIIRMNGFFYSKNEFDEAKKAPIIVHFTEGFWGRPWIKGTNHPYAYIFEKYHSMTEWRNEELREDRRPWFVRLLGWELRRCPYVIYEMTSYMLSIAIKIKNAIR